MVFGHIGVGFGLRGVRRDASLIALLVAALLPDVLDIGYAAAGVCSPAGLYSHSLPVVGALAVAVFALTYAWTRKAGLAAAMACAVLLHLPADWITGYKYLWAGGPVVGLVMYQHPIADFLLELPVIAAGWLLLRRDPRAPRWATHWVMFTLLIVGQAAFDIANDAPGSVKPTGCDQPMPDPRK